MAKRQPIEIPFPFKGVDDNWAFRRQPEGTTPDALNVRPYDVYERRLRGGQRGGHTKYFTDAVNGANAIQAIDQVTRAFDPAALDADELLFSDDFTYADGILPTTHWYLFDRIVASPPSCVFDLDSTVNGPLVKDNVIDGQDDGDTELKIGMIKDVITPGSNYMVRWTSLDNNVPGANLLDLYTIIRAGDPSVDPIAANNYGIAGLEGVNSAVAGRAFIKIGTDAVTSVDLNTDLGWADDMWTTSSHVVEVRVAGDHISVWIDGIKTVEKVTATLSGNTHIGFGVGQWLANADWQLDNFEVYTGIVPVSARTTTLVTISGGKTYGADAGGDLSEAISATADFVTSGRVATQEAFQNLYVCDSNGDNYHIYDPAAHSVSGWITTNGILPIEAATGTAAYTIDGVNQGAKTFTIIGDGDLTTQFPVDGHIIIVGSTGNDGAYQIVSTSFAGDPSFTVTVTQAIPDDTVDGTISHASLGCKLMALYRGRVVLSGLQADPHNWFMSAVGDPLDWNYSPTTVSAIQAVAGHASDAGKLGDIVTALAPYSDDLMIIGGDHTLWVMRGDPAAGGMIDNISYQTGIAGPEAFAWDPMGNLYFFGSGALWRMGAGATSLENLSQNSMATAFGAIDYATDHVRLLWDNEEKGLHIYLTPDSQPTTAPTHYFWDLRTEGFWIDQLPITLGPTAVHVYDADDPNDRAALVGGFDSYIRHIDLEGLNDDGTAIASFVDFTPAVPAGDLANARLIELTPILASDSSPVTLKVYAADTVEGVLDGTTPRYTRSLQAGRNPSIRQRVTGNAIRIRFQNESTDLQSWAMESLTGMIATAGKTRKGHL